ncbi:MAG TPA: hypothetical protein VH575_28070 [Gemmataceae bacterium]|jgi:hypothetical protein
MHKLPFRTNKTWLSDDQLILLDVLFDRGTFLRLLRRESFCEQWNLGYSHNLSDDYLQCHLHWLCEHGVLEAERDGNQTVFHMTAIGGELWSQERCPVWERYCIEQYRMTSRGRTLMSVMAVSPQVRDNFLALWPLYPARRRTATIADRGLIGWHPFGQVFVGVATYEKKQQWTRDEHAVWIEQYRRHQTVLEQERSWWRCVPELQRFVPKPV